jgi:CRISPR-associated protein (TIGR03986 family)
MAEGKIKIWVSNKGFGFIERDGLDDLFFHITQWNEPHECEPSKGAWVSFEVGPGKKGPEAKNVSLVCRFLNPYNFVRNMEQERLSDHILGNCPPPPHDRYVSLTGRIECTVEAETQLFISDSHEVHDHNGHKTYRFFQYEGQPALPASSLRGMIRAVFEAVTNSCLAVFQKDDPYPLEHRESRAPNMIPARIIELDKNGARLELLDCTINAPANISGYPIVVQGAAVKNSYPPRVLDQKTSQAFVQSLSKLPINARDRMRVAALVTQAPIKHPRKPFRAFHAVQVVPADQHSLLIPSHNYVKIFGWLHLTGPNIENKHDERLFFRWGDTQLAPQQIAQIPPSCLCDCSIPVIEEYNHHLSEYWGRLQKDVEKLGNQRWPNSTNGVPHPSTFVEAGRRLEAGDLVYIKRNSQGEVTMLRPVSMPRIPYLFRRQDFLPEHLKHCDNYQALCPACRLFGWVNDKPEDDAKCVAYASRVKFSHGKLISSKGSLPDTPLAILSSPKPTTTPFYLLDPKGEPDPLVDYNTNGARLRGRKFYRPQEKAVPEEYIGQELTDQNRTISGALNPGSTFKFTLDFKNLAPLELGALIYALELEDGMFHRLGYAKPLGFGSIKITVKSLKTINWSDRLRSLSPEAGWSPEDKTTQRKIALKNMFLKEMQTIYKAEFDTILSDMKALLSIPPELPIHYPRPPVANHPQFEWFMGNKKRRDKGVPLDLAKDDRKGLPLIDKNGDIKC